MAKLREDIIQEIKAYIEKHSGNYPNWYVGIASDAEDRLFNDHEVDKVNDLWIYEKAENSETAREIEGYFIDKLDTDGDTGGGDDKTKFVYAYKKNSHTTE